MHIPVIYPGIRPDGIPNTTMVLPGGIPNNKKDK